MTHFRIICYTNKTIIISQQEDSINSVEFLATLPDKYTVSRKLTTLSFTTTTKKLIMNKTAVVQFYKLNIYYTKAGLSNSSTSNLTDYNMNSKIPLNNDGLKCQSVCLCECINSFCPIACRSSPVSFERFNKKFISQLDSTSNRIDIKSLMLKVLDDNMKKDYLI